MANRCKWAGNDPLMQKYHDFEWGVVSRDDRYLFEMITLEGAQAGLSWQLIINKREDYRAAFQNFSVEACAALTDEELEEIRLHTGVVKNKLKIRSVRSNAIAFQNIQAEFGSFADYIWRFSDLIVNDWEDDTEVPAQSELSEHISKDLKKRGFKFVGPVIIYSFLQAIGMINDHVRDCSFKNAVISSGEGMCRG